MRAGSDRVDIAYTWPTTLERQPSPPKLVYLDLNHWIAFAKAHAGHPDGECHQEALTAVSSATARGVAAFPISDVIYTEVSKIASYRQRHALREVIERVSRYMVVTSRTVIATHEIEAMLDTLFGSSAHPINRMAYLDWGVARAFGKVGGFRVRTATGEDVTGKARETWKDGPDAFDALFAAAELELQRRTLDGPSPDEEEHMRELGWDPYSAMEVTERRATQEIEQVARFDADPSWRRGRIRDVIAAREILIEINETMSKGMLDRGVALDDAFASADTARRAFDSMPSFDVAVTLKTSYHRDGRHRWTRNDIHDIDALASTLPYCDIVVTDKAIADHANRTGLAERFGTVVLSRLADLLTEI
jgi:hypothetical protein